MNKSKKSSAEEVLIKASINKLYPTLVFTAITMGVTNIIDSLCASTFIGVNGVAAIGITIPISSFYWMFIHVFAKGSQIISGKKLGKGKISEVVEIFNSSLLMMSVIGILVGIIIYLQCDSIAYLLGASDNIHPYVSSYLRGLAIYLPFLLVYQTLVEYMPFEGGEKKLIEGITAITICDGIFNVTFVKLLGLGMFGLSLASVAATIVGLVIVQPFFMKKDRSIRLKPGLQGMRYMKEAISMGLAGGYFEICNFILPICINHLMMHYAGVEAISAMCVAGSIRFFMKSFMFAESDICSSMGSVFYGERDEKSLIYVVKNALTIGFIYYSVTAVVIFLLSGRIIPFFSGGSDRVIAIAYPAVTFTLIQLVFQAINLVIIRTYQVLGKRSLSAVLNVIVFFFVPLVTGSLMIPWMGAMGLWLSWPLSHIISLLLIIVLNVIKQRKRVITADDIITFGDHFDVPVENKFLYSIRSMGDVQTSSEKAYLFVKDFGFGARKALYSSMLIEELCKNTVTHGFLQKSSGGSSDACINLTVYQSDDKIHICIRDNGMRFDPIKYASKFHTVNVDDPARNIGMRLVAAKSHEMTYRNLFHMNVVTIIL